MRFPIAFSWWYRILSWAILVPPSRAFVTVEADQVTVQMGWAFRARFARSVVTNVERDRGRPISRGVHGWRGRWLVNGAGQPLVGIELDPAPRAYVTGVPVRLRRVIVSVHDADALIGAFR